MNTFAEFVFSWRFAAKALTWGAAMLGVLQLQHVSGPWSHSICGPWGCGPPLEAVATCHLLWAVVFAPLVVVLIGRSSSVMLRRVGAVTAAIGGIGLAAVGIWVAVLWYPQTSVLQRPYVLQKFAFTLACLVDVPIVQVAVCGAILYAASRRAGRSHPEAEQFEGARSL